MEDELEQLAAAHINSLLGFNGERIDPVLGSYHLGNGYRMYNPTLRRFMSPDSMSPFGAGGINPYVYCAGDPINHTDPTGHVGIGLFIGLGLMVGGVLTGDPAVVAEEGESIAANSARRASEEMVGESSEGGSSDHFNRRARERRGIRQRKGAGPSLQTLGAGRTASTTSSAVSDRAAMEYINNPNNFRHHMDGFEITSQDRLQYDNFFENSYFEDKWRFQTNNRNRDASYYASHIVKYQYEMVSKANGFYGKHPGIIERNTVVNDKTIEATNGLTGSELNNVFFETPIGKSTRHIMEAFGLKSMGVTRKRNDFFVNIAPIDEI
ncbi:RHS repeat-associated core domain-containing protein [Serratia marcescens]|uniref:RHS repeat-associated core domain-containing protein n=1 Tax=Serratia marcescens TaxID=615 RepID=UPI001EF13FC0|nr:RHS repeat-associated core domain-containing protein [Serratia marcescens]ULH10795.1 RHS repeat-associated core domain-containing protein [Serratia marcescens]